MANFRIYQGQYLTCVTDAFEAQGFLRNHQYQIIGTHIGINCAPGVMFVGMRTSMHPNVVARSFVPSVGIVHFVPPSRTISKDPFFKRLVAKLF